MTIYTITIKGRIFKKKYKAIGDNLLSNEILSITTPEEDVMYLQIKKRLIYFSKERMKSIEENEIKRANISAQQQAQKTIKRVK